MDAHLYVLTEHVEGETLKAALDRCRIMTEERTRRIVASIADALNCLHEHLIVDLNLDPQFVYVDRTVLYSA